MIRIGKLEGEIRDVVNDRASFGYELVADEDAWNRLTSSLDLLGDTALGLLDFEERKFGQPESGEAYLRFYGVVQALVLQQEAIATIYSVLYRKNLDVDTKSSWEALRRFRNRAVGHPLDGRSYSLAGDLRTFVARAVMTPEEILTISFEEKTGAQRSERFNLSKHYDGYKTEAITVLQEIRAEQDRRRPDGDAV